VLEILETWEDHIHAQEPRHESRLSAGAKGDATATKENRGQRGARATAEGAVNSRDFTSHDREVERLRSGHQRIA
jgi:hypothetical protein